MWSITTLSTVRAVYTVQTSHTVKILMLTSIENPPPFVPFTQLTIHTLHVNCIETWSQRYTVWTVWTVRNSIGAQTVVTVKTSLSVRTVPEEEYCSNSINISHCDTCVCVTWGQPLQPYTLYVQCILSIRCRMHRMSSRCVDQQCEQLIPYRRLKHCATYGQPRQCIIDRYVFYAVYTSLAVQTVCTVADARDTLTLHQLTVRDVDTAQTVQTVCNVWSVETVWSRWPLHVLYDVHFIHSPNCLCCGNRIGGSHIASDSCMNSRYCIDSSNVVWSIICIKGTRCHWALHILYGRYCIHSADNLYCDKRTKTATLHTVTFTPPTRFDFRPPVGNPRSLRKGHQRLWIDKQYTNDMFRTGGTTTVLTDTHCQHSSETTLTDRTGDRCSPSYPASTT